MKHMTIPMMVTVIAGCVSNDREPMPELEVKPPTLEELKPLPPKSIIPDRFVYKSVTPKDYEQKEIN
jgi:hypothetical protein